MMRWLVWRIQDLAVYLPEPIRRWWHWEQLRRLR